MIFYALAFLAGDIYLQTFKNLPEGGFVICLLLASIIKPQRYFIAFALGFTWGFWIAQSTLSWTLAREMETKAQTITGRIVSLPVAQQFGTKFIFALDDSGAKLSLNNQDNSLNLVTGDKWQFKVKLKRIHGVQSPGAFDYEAWGLQNGIRATGYVIKSPENNKIKSVWYDYPMQRFRTLLKTKIQQHSNNPALLALMIGEREGFTQADWKILRNTGTNHLMAIGGLHIGILALIMHFIFKRLWLGNAIRALYFPAFHIGLIAALVAAVFYSALAGFSLPTERACIMLCIYIFTVIKRRTTNHWHIWSISLLSLLILNPLSILNESFWLSLGTIALIIYGMQGRIAPDGWWWKWGRVQLVIAIGLIPLSLLLFQQISLVSYCANGIAIPALTLILPLCLLSIPLLFISQTLSHALIWVADKLLASLWLLLTWLAHFASLQFSLPDYTVFFLLMAAILLFLTPRGVPGKYLGLLWILPCLTYHYPRPEKGDLTLSILDVGQGLSAIVQTKNHLLVYDAGPGFFNSTNMGESVVIPFIHSYGRNKVDMLVISHGDSDHIGGAQAIVDAMPVYAIKTSVPQKLPTAVTDFCRAGVSWTWDDVAFSFIYPYSEAIKPKNDDSCVLRVVAGNKSIMLPGDIEKRAEKRMLKNNENLQSTIIIAPHHGSKTSGLSAFVAAVKPQYVLYATGYLNRYHFPNEFVVEAYAKLHALQLNTADTGTINIEITKTQTNIDLYRQSHKRYWF